MSTFVIQNAQGEQQRVTSLDGYDMEEWEHVETIDEEPPHDFHRLIDGVWQEDPAMAEAKALAIVEAECDDAVCSDIKRARRQIAIALLWEEIQRLKLANMVPGAIPADLTARRKMFPTLMAVVALSGNTLAQVATALENRLWDRVRRASLWEAKLMLGHDAVRAAISATDKLAAAKITWTE